MKTTKTLLFFLFLVLSSCSTDSDNEIINDTKKDIANEYKNDTAEKDFPNSKYAMTATVHFAVEDTLIKKKPHSYLWEANNPFGTNTATKPILAKYPATDFIQLQGKMGTDEITLYINKKNLAIGIYHFRLDTYSASNTQIEANFKINNTSQYIFRGGVSINALNKKAKKVAGTFYFYCIKKNEPLSLYSNPVTIKVTDGTFNYKYD